MSQTRIFIHTSVYIYLITVKSGPLHFQFASRWTPMGCLYTLHTQFIHKPWMMQSLGFKKALLDVFCILDKKKLINICK